MQETSFTTLLHIKDKFDNLSGYLNERSIRIWCATEANNYDKLFGRGGVTAVERATGISRPTIYSGIKELKDDTQVELNRMRHFGAGRKKLTEEHPKLLNDLELLVEPLSRGDPESALRWTSKSVRNLSDELILKGYNVSFRT